MLKQQILVLKVCSLKLTAKKVKDDLSFQRICGGSKAALTQFMHILSETSSNSETRLKMNEVKATSKHQGINAKGEKVLYPLELSDESDGTRKLMSIAPAIESVLNKGGVLIIDEIEKKNFIQCLLILLWQNSRANSRIRMGHSLYLQHTIQNL